MGRQLFADGTVVTADDWATGTEAADVEVKA
jgi:hypothetical protein